MPGSSQSLLPNAQVGKSVVGPRTFITVWELLWYNCSPVCGMSAWWLYGRIMASSSKNSYATHSCACEVCCSQSPCPHGRPLLTHASAGDTQRHGSEVAMSLAGLWALVHARFCLSPPRFFDGYGFDSKLHFTFPTILLGLLICLWMWGIFFCVCGIQHSPVDGYSATSCNFGVIAGENECMSFYSAI